MDKVLDDNEQMNSISIINNQIVVQYFVLFMITCQDTTLEIYLFFFLLQYLLNSVCKWNEANNDGEKLESILF